MNDEWDFSQIKNLPKLLIEYKSGEGYEWQIVVEVTDDITSANYYLQTLALEKVSNSTKKPSWHPLATVQSF